jgi:hypothetical protein
MVMRLDVGVDFAQRAEAIAGPEDVVRPAAVVDDDLLGADGAVDGQLLRCCRADTDVAIAA